MSFCIGVPPPPPPWFVSWEGRFTLKWIFTEVLWMGCVYLKSMVSFSSIARVLPVGRPWRGYSCWLCIRCKDDRQGRGLQCLPGGSHWSCDRRQGIDGFHLSKTSLHAAIIILTHTFLPWGLTFKVADVTVCGYDLYGDLGRYILISMYCVLYGFLEKT